MFECVLFSFGNKRNNFEFLLASSEARNITPHWGTHPVEKSDAMVPLRHDTVLATISSLAVTKLVDIISQVVPTTYGTGYRIVGSLQTDFPFIKS